MHRRIARRLVLHHRLGGRLGLAGVARRRGHLGHHVEVLTRHHAEAHPLELDPRPVLPGRAGEHAREGRLAHPQRDVAGEDRGGDAEVLRGVAPARLPVEGLEAAVHAGHPAAGVRAVQDVVVDQRRGLEQLERRARLGDAGVLRLATGRPPAEPGQDGAQALAARGQVRDRVHEGRGQRVDVPGEVPVLRQQAVEGVGDGGAEAVLVGGTGAGDGDVGGHGPTLAAPRDGSPVPDRLGPCPRPRPLHPAMRRRSCTWTWTRSSCPSSCANGPTSRGVPPPSPPRAAGPWCSPPRTRRGPTGSARRCPWRTPAPCARPSWSSRRASSSTGPSPPR